MRSICEQLTAVWPKLRRNEGQHWLILPGPSIFTAIQEQLGLKLDSQKAPSRSSLSIMSRHLQKTN
ncbi:MAG TPA: DUF3738 domain-containing protein [Acidobacteriaceae bacterium]